MSFTNNWKVVTLSFTIGFGVDFAFKNKSPKFSCVGAITSIAFLALSHIIGKHAAISATFGVFLLTKNIFEKPDSDAIKTSLLITFVGITLSACLANPSLLGARLSNYNIRTTR